MEARAQSNNASGRPAATFATFNEPTLDAGDASGCAGGSDTSFTDESDTEAGPTVRPFRPKGQRGKDVDSQPPKSLKEKIRSGLMGLGIGVSLSLLIFYYCHIRF